MTQSRNYMLLTEFSVKQGTTPAAIHSWKKLYEDVNGRSLYKKKDEDYLLELVILDRPASVENELSCTLRHSYSDLIKPTLLSDFRMQLLGLKNKIVTNSGLLPTTDYLQLRYIEVPLCMYDEYFQWRRPNIFKYIEKFSKIEYFMAYHTVLSTKPGVLFLSGFSGNINEYLEIFSAKEFQKISSEAKQKYIFGGDQGLFITLYEKV